MEISRLYEIYKSSTGVSTDTRKVSGGELFFALKGENFDGNDYALKALELGASFVVVNEDSQAWRSASDAQLGRIIPVKDTLRTLQELATWHREHVLVDGKRLAVIGLTGTNGKTTTKELLNAVLSRKYVVTATQGNLNNSIGVPLTLLSINDKTEIAVVEMGANHPEDIVELVNVCHPDCGLITCVGKGHLLGFGDFDGVKRAKGALYDYLSGHGGLAFVNCGDEDLVEMARGRASLRVLPYGLNEIGAKVLPSTPSNPFLRLEIPYGESSLILQTKLVGAYNAVNAIAAIAVGDHFGVDIKEAVDAISSYVPSNNRSQMVRTERNTLIVDAYNANPMSMNAALDSFANIASDKKIVCLGNMGELGAESLAEHMKLLERIADEGYWMTVLVGEQFRLALEKVGGFSPIYFETSSEAADFLSMQNVSGATVLIKGSRSTRMETVISAL